MSIPRRKENYSQVAIKSNRKIEIRKEKDPTEKERKENRYSRSCCKLPISAKFKTLEQCLKTYLKNMAKKGSSPNKIK